MYKNMFNLARVRTAGEALVFYGEWLLLVLLCAGLLVMCVNALSLFDGIDDQFLFRLGQAFSVSITTALAVRICYVKGLLREHSSITLIIFTVILSLTGGVFLGLTIPAFLAIRQNI
jgi:hypothetical protein